MQTTEQDLYVHLCLASAQNGHLLPCLCLQMFAEAVLEPGHLPDPAASLQDVPVPLTHGAAAMQWELRHLKESLAAAKQQEADTM